MGTIAIVGGTGAEGIGLGLRFALSGETVRLGSRQAARAVEAARQAMDKVPATAGRIVISGHENGEAVEGADVVVLAFPYSGVNALLPQLAARLAGKLIIDVVNPLVRENGVFKVAHVDAGSAGEAIQNLLPQSEVVSALKNQSAEELLEIERPLHGDVLCCSNHAAARTRVMEMVGRLPALRPVDAGQLVAVRSVESITAMLLNLNRRHHAITSIQILGLPSTNESR